MSGMQRLFDSSGCVNPSTDDRMSFTNLGGLRYGFAATTSHVAERPMFFEQLIDPVSDAQQSTAAPSIALWFCNRTARMVLPRNNFEAQRTWLASLQPATQYEHMNDKKVEAWIVALKQNKNPFDKATLAALR